MDYLLSYDNIINELVCFIIEINEISLHNTQKNVISQNFFKLGFFKH